MKTVSRKTYQRRWYQKNKKKVAASHRAYYQKNKKKTIARQRAYYQKNKKRANAATAAWQKKNPKKVKSYYLARLYGISLGEFLKLKKTQNGRCAICKKRFKKTLSVDHDHKTRKIRGLLCLKCNLILGLAKDSVKTLRQAITYLTTAPA